jgi:hypothetical protein
MLRMKAIAGRSNRADQKGLALDDDLLGAARRDRLGDLVEELVGIAATLRRDSGAATASSAR